jgi:hypothetical protein
MQPTAVAVMRTTPIRARVVCVIAEARFRVMIVRYRDRPDSRHARRSAHPVAP